MAVRNLGIVSHVSLVLQASSPVAPISSRDHQRAESVLCYQPRRARRSSSASLTVPAGLLAPYGIQQWSTLVQIFAFRYLCVGSAYAARNEARCPLEA